MGRLKLAACIVSLAGVITSCGASVEPQVPDKKAAKGAPACSTTRVPVALQDGGPADYEVAVRLCHEGSGPVQLLIHGSTYGAYYWDFPYHPKEYSYAQTMRAHGLSTLNLEQIGTLPSSQPPVQDVSMASMAHVIHQVVQGLRAGAFGELAFAPFDTVYLVGHSMGSAAAIEEAASYKDVDGLIITGLLQQFLGTGLAELSLQFYPANQDPKFAGQNVPDGYVTTRPGTRGPLFYYLANTDPAVVAVDEELKQTHPPVAGVTLFASQRKSALVDVPVWMLVGQYDTLFCGIAGDCTSAVSAGAEAPHWPAAPCFDLTVVRNMGHDVTLHIGASAWFEEAARRIRAGSLCQATLAEQSGPRPRIRQPLRPGVNALHFEPQGPAKLNFAPDFVTVTDWEWGFPVGGFGGIARGAPLNHVPVIFVHGNADDHADWYVVRDDFLAADSGWSNQELWGLAYNGLGTNAGSSPRREQPARDAEHAEMGWDNRSRSTNNDLNVEDLFDFIRAVQDYTGTNCFALVGHSLGVTVARKTLWAYPELRQDLVAFVGIAGANHGASLCPPGSGTDSAVVSCDEIEKNSAWLAQLNGPDGSDETYPPAQWMTVYDGSGLYDVTYYTPDYAQSPRLEGADNREYPGKALTPGKDHNNLRIDPGIVSDYRVFLENASVASGGPRAAHCLGARRP